MKSKIKKITIWLILMVFCISVIPIISIVGCKAAVTEEKTVAAEDTAVVAASQEKEKMFYGHHHIGIYVTDRDASVAFYRDHLGFVLDFTEEVEAGNGFLKIAVMRQNGINVELLQLVDSSQVKQQAEQTWNHFALYVKDIDKAIADLEAAGIDTFEGEDPVLVVPGFGKEDVLAAFFRGINGERIEIIEAVNTETNTAAAAEETAAASQEAGKMFYGLHHIGIYVTDKEASQAFYRDNLGFTTDFTEEVEAGNGFLKIAVMRQNTINVELLQLVDSSQVKQQAEQTWNHFALYVKDIDKAIADLKATGNATFEGDDPVLVVPGFGKEDVLAAFMRTINGERIEIIEAVDSSE